VTFGHCERTKHRWCENPLSHLLFCFLAVSAASAQESRQVELLKTDSQAPYVHRLTLYDEEGKAIDPADPRPAPYSPKATCGKCHEIAEIAHGWHLNAWDPNVPAGRPGEPWMLTDPRTGTVLPISGRRWPGTFTPEQVGLSDWQFVLRFGGHTPGGGYGDPDPDTIAKSREAARWRVSGPLEVDCMFCHSADQQHDPAEAAKQIEAQNFRWAPTVALGLGVVRGEARKAPDDWDPTAPPDPDYPERSGPKLIYDKKRFDLDNRVLFNITRRPPVDHCYFCHTVRQVGPGAPDDLVASRDVHIAAGLLCVDCHRSEVDHMLVRGYDTEAAETGQPWRAAFTCEGCHLGTGREYLQESEGPEPNDPAVRLGGRYAAPRPEHRGLPPVHLEKLTCTACHSGPWPEMTPKQVQTALAHGLGLATRDRKDSDEPIIVEPIFAKQPDGKLAPQRLLWPAFWAYFDEKGVRALGPDAVLKLTGRVLPKAVSQSTRLEQEQVNGGLEALLQGLPSTDEVLYVDNGQVLVRTRQDERAHVNYYWPRLHGALVIKQNLETQFPAPYRWSMAHDVRPASQALGVRGCTDCHADAAPFYYCDITPPSTGRPHAPINLMGLRHDDEDLVRMWNLGFRTRPGFKWFVVICTAILFLTLLGFALDCVMGGVFAPASAPRVVPGAVPVQPRGLTRWEHVFHTVAGITLVLLAITGFGPKLVGGEVKGWTLLAHIAIAPLFILGLTVVVPQWAGRCRFAGRGGSFAVGVNMAQRQMFWIVLLLGFVSLVTMLIAMRPIYGPAGQRTLIEVHSYSSLLLLIAMVPHTIVSWRAWRARRKST
jgi:hypothetical protein